MAEHVCKCHGRSFRRASSLGLHMHHERRKAERADRAEKEACRAAEDVLAPLPAVLTLNSPEARREAQARAWEYGVDFERKRILAAIDAALPAVFVDGGTCCDRARADVLRWCRKVVSGD